eukprot:PhM_4_TR9643/c0_g1_i1/m.106420
MMIKPFLYGVLLWCTAFSIVTLSYKFMPSDTITSWSLHLRRYNMTYLPPTIVACSPSNNTNALLNVQCYSYEPWQRHKRKEHPCSKEATSATANLLTVVNVEGYGEMQCVVVNQEGQPTWGPRGREQLHLHFSEHRKDMIFFVHHSTTPLDLVQYDIAGADSMLLMGLQRKERRPYKQPVEVRYDAVKNSLPMFGPDSGVHLVVRYNSQYVESWVEDVRQESWWDWASKVTALVLLVEKCVSFGQKMLVEYTSARERGETLTGNFASPIPLPIPISPSLGAARVLRMLRRRRSSGHLRRTATAENDADRAHQRVEDSDTSSSDDDAEAHRSLSPSTSDGEGEQEDGGEGVVRADNDEGHPPHHDTLSVPGGAASTLRHRRRFTLSPDPSAVAEGDATPRLLGSDKLLPTPMVTPTKKNGGRKSRAKHLQRTAVAAAGHSSSGEETKKTK